MAIIKVVDGQFVRFYDRWQLAQDYPDINFPLDFLIESNPEIVNYNAFPCEVLPKPLSVDERDYDLTLGTPICTSGTWQQGWVAKEKTPEEKRLARYNPPAFLKAMESNESYQTWSFRCPANAYAHLLIAIERATESHDWSTAQSIYNKLVAITPHLSKNEFQAIATNYGIPFQF